MHCATDGCARPVGRNGIVCHDCFTGRVPGFLARAYFAARRGSFDREFYARQIANAVNGRDWTP